MNMKIGKKVYDTETAEPIRHRSVGSWGDPAGFEETLYRTPDGFYFLWGRGGVDSPYPTERIRRIPKAEAEDCLSGQ